LEQKYDINRDDIKHFLKENADIQEVTEQDVQQTELALIQFAQAHAIEPQPSLQQHILTKIAQLNAHKANPQAYDLNHLPLLTPDANWLIWQETVKSIQPPDEYENVHLHSLETNDTRDLFLAFVKEVVPEEVHHDVLESFILLDGTCECHIFNEDGTQQTVKMRAGDYIAFEIGETHDICITSSTPAIAILQWLKVAA
jgi:mannose-6-phosphate isomerase-like protein (cupin superfamily)